MSKSFMKVSGDPIVGTDQARVQFWVRITSEYNKMCEIINNRDKEDQEDGFLQYIERTMDSLKSRWTQKILPAVNKFKGICDTNPPSSGEVKDDALMDKYYERMRSMYAERASTNMWKGWKGPKRFDEFMKSYLWLIEQPRFASIFELERTTDPNESKKQKKKVPVRSKRPEGRDSAKHAHAINAIKDKITEEVSNELSHFSSIKYIPSSGEASNLNFAQSIKDGMKELKDGMVEMAQYQIESAQYQAMASAPSPIKKQFYSALYSNVMDSISLKVQKRALEVQEMEIAKKRLSIEERELAVKEKELMLKSMELDRALNNTTVDLTSTDSQKINDLPHDLELNAPDEEERIPSNACSWPDCAFGMSLLTEICQVCHCNYLHHVCQTEWEHKNGLDNETLHKICFPCAERFKAENDAKQA